MPSLRFCRSGALLSQLLVDGALPTVQKRPLVLPPRTDPPGRDPGRYRTRDALLSTSCAMNRDLRSVTIRLPPRRSPQSIHPRRGTRAGPLRRALESQNTLNKSIGKRGSPHRLPLRIEEVVGSVDQGHVGLHIWIKGCQQFYTTSCMKKRAFRSK